MPQPTGHDPSFVFASQQLPVHGAVLLDTDTDDGDKIPSGSSVGSSMIEYYVAEAVAAVPGVGVAREGLWPPADLDDDGGLSPMAGQSPIVDASRRRRGGLAGKGGRPEGTGIRTRENFPRGALRILAGALEMLGVEAALEHALMEDVDAQHQRNYIAFLDEWKQLPGKEEIWAIPYLFGVVARFSIWGKTDHGKRSACCTWVATGGAVRCTCVGNDVYNGDTRAGRDSTCEHIDVFVDAIGKMAAKLGRPFRSVAMWLQAVLSAPGASDGADVDRAYEEVPVWRLHRDIVVVVAPHRGAPVPVPVYLPKRGVSCGFCPLTNLRGCSHTKVAEQYRSSSGAAVVQSNPTSCLRSAVSTLPVSLFNCPLSITRDRRIGELARLNAVWRLEAPVRCGPCGAAMRAAGKVADVTLEGTIHSTLGPCKMEVVKRTCDECLESCSRDGREESVILLAWTSGCTIIWARRCAEQVRAGTHIADVITQCKNDWAGLKSASLLPASAKWRGSDTLRAMILTIMRLAVSDPDPGLYDCTVCQLPCGRYLIVTADGICIGFDADNMPFSFEHVCEDVPFVNMKGREGCMVVGEMARRMMRHVLVPGDTAAVSDRTLPSAEIALRSLARVAFAVESGDDVVPSSTSSIRVLLGMIWKMEAAALPLAESLLLAYESTKVKRIKEKQRRAQCALRLRAAIEKLKKDDPEIVALAGSAWVGADDEDSAGKGTCDGDASGVAGALGDQGASRGGSQGGPPDRVGRDGRGGRGGRGANGRPPTGAPTGWTNKSKAKKRSGADVRPGEEPALGIPRPLLQAHLQALDDNDIDHICRMALAFALDPVIAGIKERHFAGLEHIAKELRRGCPRAPVEVIIAEATSRARGGRPLTQAADCLVQLRHVLVALQAAVLVFDATPTFALAIAAVLEDAVRCARAFYSDFSEDLQRRHEYLSRYLDLDATEEDLFSAFRRRYPHAPVKTASTGVFMPGREQCRAEAYAKGDKTACGTCEKGFASSEKYSDGAVTLCCAFSHPKILGFVVLDRRESPQVLINALLTRFPRLPRYLVYDFACGVVRCAMVKLPWMLRDLCVVSDRFHVCNHTCSHFYNANSYGELDFKNTLTHEQRNVAIRKMEAILRGAGRYGYLALLCYQTSVLNSFAESRTVYQQNALAAAVEQEAESRSQARPSTKPRVTLPAHFDMRQDYFTRHACRCCGYKVGARGGETIA